MSQTKESKTDKIGAAQAAPVERVAAAGTDLRPEWGIFVPAVLVIMLISIPSLLYPKAAEEIVSAIYKPFAANFGTLYLWITVGLIALCVYFAFIR